NEVLGGTLGIMILAVLFDLVYVALSRITIPSGLR
ncbi:MAG: ABC transporter permease, partial [Actinomycetota bacterium]|nr:ABC transporter permease [Actinomycetota bacterium]